MNIEEGIKSNAMESYFKEKSTQWIPELLELAAKAGVDTCPIEDHKARKRIERTRRFSWLGFFLHIYWASYHNATGWLSASITYALALLIDYIYFGEKYTIAINIGVSVVYAMYGKSFLLSAKLQEMADGLLRTTSWGRVVVSMAIVIVPNVLVILYI
jgi:hypothetical protein